MIANGTEVLFLQEASSTSKMWLTSNQMIHEHGKNQPGVTYRAGWPGRRTVSKGKMISSSV